MTIREPQVISESTVTAAWARAFIGVFDGSKARVAPMMISVQGGRNALPAEDEPLLAALDSQLLKHGKPTTAQTAFTIFPYEMWRRRGEPPVAEFCDLCVQRLYPRMRARSTLNRYGTYFQRMMAFPDPHQTSTTNQLAHVIGLLARARKSRESALQISVLDPSSDHTGQAVRGFPCLQQVGISYGDADGFCLNAFYPTQYMFDRGYGNYLGLHHLGLFIETQCGREFQRLNCFVGSPSLGSPAKGQLRDVVNSARVALADISPEGDS